jgi:hypothetical protein
MLRFLIPICIVVIVPASLNAAKSPKGTESVLFSVGQPPESQKKKIPAIDTISAGKGEKAKPASADSSARRDTAKAVVAALKKDTVKKSLDTLTKAARYGHRSKREKGRRETRGAFGRRYEGRRANRQAICRPHLRTLHFAGNYSSDPAFFPPQGRGAPVYDHNAFVDYGPRGAIGMPSYRTVFLRPRSKQGFRVRQPANRGSLPGNALRKGTWHDDRRFYNPGSHKSFTEHAGKKSATDSGRTRRGNGFRGSGFLPAVLFRDRRYAVRELS